MRLDGGRFHCLPEENWTISYTGILCFLNCMSKISTFINKTPPQSLFVVVGSGSRLSSVKDIVTGEGSVKVVTNSMTTMSDNTAPLNLWNPYFQGKACFEIYVPTVSNYNETKQK